MSAVEIRLVAAYVRSGDAGLTDREASATVGCPEPSARRTRLHLSLSGRLVQCPDGRWRARKPNEFPTVAPSRQVVP